MASESPEILRFEEITVDVAGRTVRLPNGEVSLSHIQFSLLETFARRPGRVLSRDQLRDAIASRGEPYDRSVDVLIARLRRRIEPNPKVPRLIVTVAGAGYKFSAKPLTDNHGNGKSTASAVLDRPSIAVLPFTNIGGGAEQDYFCDGVVDDLITSLSRIKWLFVIGRNSSFTYRGRAVDAKQVGRELGVRYVLGGSLRKAAGSIRITCQLVDAATDTHIWADRYERELKNIFELQDEITMQVVGTIEPSLRHFEIERAKRKRPDCLDAYDLYLRALPHVFTSVSAETDKALAWLAEALKLEMDYASAHAAMAWCYGQRYVRDSLSLVDKTTALHHARAAIATGADDAMALAMAGFVIALLDHDYEAGLSATNRALALSGSSALAHGIASIIHGWLGDEGRTTEHAARALRLSPFDSLSYIPHLALANVHFKCKHFERAVDAAREATQSNPRFHVPYLVQAAALSRLGRLDEGKVLVRRALELQPNYSITRLLAAEVGGATHAIALAEALRPLGLPEQSAANRIPGLS